MGCTAQEAQDLGPLATETAGQGEILRLAGRGGGVISKSHDLVGKRQRGSYMVTRLAWMAAKLVSSNKDTR